MPTRPMLDDVELQQVQQLRVKEEEVVCDQKVPALEGDLLEDLGRRAERIRVKGVVTGPHVQEQLKTLGAKFRNGKPVPFIADIVSATKVQQVLVEEMQIRELAGKPERFEYDFSFVEFLTPPKAKEEPPPAPPPPPPAVNTATLIVEVIVKDQPNFDMSGTTVTLNGTQQNGSAVNRTLSNRANNVWAEQKMVPGKFTVKASITTPQSMAGSADAEVQAGQTTKATIILEPGTLIAKAFVVHFGFDRAFIEPCLRPVMRDVSDYAQAHPEEKLAITGHTDLVGSAQYNQSLSERRARSAFAYLSFGRDRTGALAEWNALRLPQSVGFPTTHDNWGTRECQWILQDLGYFPGQIEGDPELTNTAIRAFQTDQGLSPDGVLADQTWKALIEAYLNQEPLAVPDSQFLRNANPKAGCAGGTLKWLGCGEQDPIKNTQDAWRPNRRVEFLFVKADSVPCEVLKPDTFDLPVKGAVGSAWCLGTGTTRCCFSARNAPQAGKWLIQPAQTGTVNVRGSIRTDDGKPLANAKYVLIAPDGENMNGERARGAGSGRPISGITASDGAFSYPDKPKGPGVYSLEIKGPWVLRLATDRAGKEKASMVARLDGTGSFDLIAVPLQAKVTSGRMLKGSAIRK